MYSFGEGWSRSNGEDGNELCNSWLHDVQMESNMATTHEKDIYSEGKHAVNILLRAEFCT